MYEFHGWITLRETFENREMDECQISKIASDIKLHIEKLNWYHGVIGIRPINVEYYIWTVGASNHKPQDSDSPVEFFRYIGKMAPGSYGILYVIDDEDMSDENYNKFKVYVLKKGTVEERNDPFLSPFTPTVENFPSD